ncbi:AMP-dependent synthetase/ligase [Saccharothrix luteola]|uniref:AMP-dependent synthetase/ligase n=1 Tax=Saccharothrix luteola TaxID=2893018 RepID=UPI001E2DD583|nr:long-chain fatty acid--CoA ligase [Saccharothrix luteola]MCC8244163.1 long-chain fatty acid--CoA ligase [Saccharothrix luteola]MCC8250885.1 long-chain fatty acid--CoA ligase [Saccharothrix luteola]
MPATTARVIADLPFTAAQAHDDRVAWRHSRDGQWHDLTFTEVAEWVMELASGLVHLGVEPGDRVCVLADTRVEWSAAELAVLAAGGVVVPIYPSSAAEECAWIIGDSGAVLVIAEDDAQRDKVESIREQVPSLRDVIVIEGGGLDELRSQGRTSPLPDELDDRRAAIDPDDPTVIIYTSGTTGPPKGCVLTNRNWLTMCRLSEELSYVLPDDVAYLFLPLAHVFAQIVHLGALYTGHAVAFYGGDTSKVVAELAQVRPTFLPSVPRIFEKIYTAATAGVPAERLRQAVEVGLAVRRAQAAGRPLPPDLAAAFEQVDPVFAKVRAIFGGRLRQALSGAAPISVEVLEFFTAAGVPVLEGYGMSESTGVGTVNTLARHKLGSVGTFGMAGLQLKVAEDGELLMQGPHVFAGYWNNPAATAEVLTDGWLHTGDLGEVDDDGFVTITGRKKDIIITAGGKNIAPANVENQLRQSRWISHAVVYGDLKPYLVALITLDVDEIVPWAKARGLPTDLPALARTSEVRDLIQGVVDEANSHFAHVSQIKRFTVLDRDLSQDEGELTPTLKVKRKVVHSTHAALYDGLYS